jgi:hypothetical protein
LRLYRRGIEIWTRISLASLYAARLYPESLMPKSTAPKPRRSPPKISALEKSAVRIMRKVHEATGGQPQ